MLIRKLLTSLVLIASASHGAIAEDARAIVKSYLDRNDGTTEINAGKLVSCRYAMKDGKLICAEKPQIKVMESVRKDYGATEKDSKTVSIIVSPASEKGVGFLQYDYEEIERDSDQWMYFSALRKVKRIVSGSENEPKTGSFFGSEYSYEDMEKDDLEDHTYKLIGSETYLGRDCWVIESTPTPEEAKKSNYGKSTSWIDKERNLVLKSEMLDRRGREFKRLTVLKVDNINGVWMAMVSTMNNLQAKRMSTLIKEKISLNAPVQDDYLTQRTLTDEAFRESRLQEFRQSLERS
ncbi:MAG: outer membrane lipoprotein-sorting protein [Exilibacterium sp.]